jgi:hypothetical protein
LWEETIPEVHEKIGITAAETSNEVIFVDANSFLRCLCTVEIGRDQLELDVVGRHESFKCGWTLIVYNLEFWFEATCREVIVELCVCAA